MTFEEDIKSAVDTLRKGGVILYPTDTIWGLGCDATNPKAVEKLYAVKERLEAKACLSLVDSIAMLERYVDEIPEAAEMLIDVAVEPLTIIYDSPRGISSQLIALDGSAAFRITSEKYSKELCRRLRRPVVSTSANISGDKAAACFEQINPLLIERVDYTASFGRESNPSDKASGIIKVSNSNAIKIIR